MQPPYNSPLVEPVARLRQIFDHLSTISRSPKWYEVCRVPVYELYIILSLFLYLYIYIFILLVLIQIFYIRISCI